MLFVQAPAVSEAGISNSGMRCVPDAAAVADPASGYTIVMRGLHLAFVLARPAFGFCPVDTFISAAYRGGPFACQTMSCGLSLCLLHTTLATAKLLTPAVNGAPNSLAAESDVLVISIPRTVHHHGFDLLGTLLLQQREAADHWRDIRGLAHVGCVESCHVCDPAASCYFGCPVSNACPCQV